MIRHLTTLSILHYVYGALVIIGGLVIWAFSGLVGGVLSSDLVQQSQDAPPELVGRMISGFGWGLAALFIVWGTFICLSGNWMGKGRNRVGSIVVAALCCLSFPIGTALGVFTLIVLLNNEVSQHYRALEQPGAVRS